MRVKIIILFFVWANILFAQQDSSHNKFGISVSLINFIDYSILKNEPLNSNAYYQGFDVSFLFRSPINHTQIELGVLGGDTYPIIDNLNYYFSASFYLNSKNKKYKFDINPKLMYAYSNKEYAYSTSIIHKNFSFQIGINAFRKLKRFEFGTGYYFWVSNYKAIAQYSNNHPSNGSILYQKKGFVPIGVFKLTTRLVFGK